MALTVTKADVDLANELIGQTPTVVAKAVMRRMEAKYQIAKGSIMTKARSHPITQARQEAIVEVWSFYNQNGKRLSIGVIARIFELDDSTIWALLRKRGLV